MPREDTVGKWETIKVEREGGLVRLVLNRPEVRNAFNEVMIREATEALMEIARDETARVLVITGEGKAFCAGADLHWMKKVKDFSYEENVQDSVDLADLFYRLYTLPIPTIARVNGATIGGGNGWVGSCDMAIASTEATFGLSEVKIGLIPACIGPYVLKKVGESGVRALFLTGERFDGVRAKELGLVNDAVPPAELDARVDKLVRTLLSSGKVALKACKDLIEELGHITLEEAKQYTAESLARLRVGDEAQEGMTAFFEKRKPKWAE